MRKFHHKTRLGCKQCKARRIKCDETHPVCRKCQHATLPCSFQRDLPVKPSPSVTPAVDSAHGRTIAPGAQAEGRTLPTCFEPLPHRAEFVKPSPTLPPASSTSSDNERQFGTLHLRLLSHFERDFHRYEEKMHPGLVDLLELYVNCAWTAPYLLDEVLAYAAAHKSTLDQENRHLYILESTRLQTRALEAYNCDAPILSDKTCLPMFLFSSLLSHHLIYQVGLGADDGLGPAIEAFTQSIGIHRGLIAISRAAWPMFSEDDRQKFISSCQRDYMPLPSRLDSRRECNELLSRLETAAFMDHGPRMVCCSTVEMLQDRFDAVSMADTHSMWAAIQDWLAAAPEEYVRLLEQMEPAALVVLAHFAVLVHHSAEHWFVGGLGVRLVRLIHRYLGTHWSGWLEWPLRATGLSWTPP